MNDESKALVISIAIEEMSVNDRNMSGSLITDSPEHCPFCLCFLC